MQLISGKKTTSWFILAYLNEKWNKSGRICDIPYIIGKSQ